MRWWIPLPDELVRAYRLRLQYENLLSGAAGLAKVLGIVASRARESSLSGELTVALAERLGMGAKILVCRHSLVPVNKCVATFDINAGAVPDFGDGRYLACAHWAGARPRLCRDCVSEDLAIWGIAYWKRSHQLPGVTWCVKHQRPLSESPHYLAYAQSPKLAQMTAVDLPSSDVEAAMKSSAVVRYASILELLLEYATGPVHSTCAAQVVRTQAIAKGFRVIPAREADYLSDAAMVSLPKSWLVKHFPASQTKRPQQFAAWIDQAGHARTKPVGSNTFALALALLWESPDEAVGKFLCSNSAEKVSLQRKSLARPKPELEPQALKKLWVEHKGNFHCIARATGHPYQKLKAKYYAMGLFGVDTSHFERVEAAKARFLQGESLTEASRAERVALEEIESLIRATNSEVHL